MNILLIGQGAREHALAHKISQSPQLETLFISPGNDAMETLGNVVNIADTDYETLADFAEDKEIDLTIVGPEVPLVEGIVDVFSRRGLKIFGPQKNAAKIEGSKNFAKEIMTCAGVPTADYRKFTDYETASEYIENSSFPLVLKADGLAAGKGVIIAEDQQQAREGLDKMFKSKDFGSAAEAVVIEEFLDGEEFSLMAFVNGKNVYPMVISQDHKRAFDGDQGPNTGGMGAYTRPPNIKQKHIEQSVSSILEPVACELVNQGKPFTGILYAGLILTAKGPQVIEFNARFGDPETEVILPLLENDILQVITDVLDGQDPNLRWSQDQIVGVFLAAEGYPGEYNKGHLIKGLEKLDHKTLIFHAGTEADGQDYKSSGGRVLFIGASDQTLEQAQAKVYEQIEHLDIPGLFYRRDIGYRALS